MHSVLTLTAERITVEPQPSHAAGVDSGALMPRGHVPALDGLRGVAIGLVLLRHLIPNGQGHSIVGAIMKAIASTGNAGVDLFFVLSGFLITGILLDAKGSPHYFRNFYARRTLRIFPLYYGVLLVCFGVIPLIHPLSTEAAQVAHRQGWLWFYGTNFRESFWGTHYPFQGGWLAMDHFWSLAVEEHFYLIWPLVVFVLSRRMAIKFSYGLIVLAFLLRLALHIKDVDSMAYYQLTPCRMDELVIGGLVAIFARDAKAAARLMRGARWALPILLVVTVITWPTDLREEVFGGTLLGLLFAALLIVVVTGGPRQPLARVLRLGPLRFMGKYSYATYVLHPLLMTTVLVKWPYERWVGLTHSGVVGVFLFVLTGFVVSFAAAWLTWHLFEKHFLKLKRFFEYKHTARPGLVVPSLRSTDG